MVSEVKQRHIGEKIQRMYLEKKNQLKFDKQEEGDWKMIKG